MAASLAGAAMCSPSTLQSVLAMSSTIMLRDTQMQAILLGIAFVSALCWWLLVSTMPMAGIMVCGVEGIGSNIPTWNSGRAFSLLAMWIVMTPAMMLPGAAPAIMQASWDHRGRLDVYTAAMSVASGYLLMILLGSVVAALAQWALESHGVLIGGATMGNPKWSGLLFIAAGLYQVLPFRRSPKPFCVTGTCGGGTGVKAGLRHGRACFGSCAGMICLQFAGGVMNVGWMALLTAWMLADAILPWKRHVAVLAGVALLVNGALCLAMTS
ncbi:copper chaperone [Rhizobium sp. A22-96]